MQLSFPLPFRFASLSLVANVSLSLCSLRRGRCIRLSHLIESAALCRAPVPCFLTVATPYFLFLSNATCLLNISSSTEQYGTRDKKAPGAGKARAFHAITRARRGSRGKGGMGCSLTSTPLLAATWACRMRSVVRSDRVPIRRRCLRCSSFLSLSSALFARPLLRAVP